MALLTFLLGLSIGIIIYQWRRKQIDLRLERVLSLFPDYAHEGAVFPPISRIRQGINYLQQQTQELDKALNIWQKQIEIAPIGYLLVDEDNQLLQCNQKAKEWLQITRWQSGQLRLLLELVRSYELDQLVEETRTQQCSKVLEWILHTPLYSQDAEVKPQQSLPASLPLKATTIPLPNGQVGVFLENLGDVYKLIQSRDRVTSDLAHELRTPLTSIALVAETLRDRLSPPESRWSEQMLRETKRLMHLVQDWLDISQLEENPIEQLNLETIEIHSLILSAWETLEPLAQQKKLILTYSGANEIFLTADPTRLTQVFLNLFDNGIKHSQPQTEITVKVQSFPESGNPDKDNYIQIEIIDSGAGFSEVDLPYIFERLYRGDPSRVRAITESDPPANYRRGSGLGLAIVRQIILAHSGSITAGNYSGKGGAWLIISLPKLSSLPEKAVINEKESH